MIACELSGRLEALDQIAEALVVRPGAAPAASLAVAYRGSSGQRWTVATGAAGKLAPWSPEPATPETPFDLASVTKPFTAVALARLAHTGQLELDATLGVLLDAARDTPVAGVPLELVLAHRAGLHAHLPLYEPLLQRRAVRGTELLTRAAHATRPECAYPLPAAGFAPVYSDLGYLLAGATAAQAAGEAFDVVIARCVVEPLGLAIGSARQWLERDPGFMRHVAPTEHVPWRGGVVSGVVHDENAWAAAGFAAAGHAGLFGTAESVVRFGAAVLDALAGRLASWLPAATVARLVEERPGGSLRAGFDGKSREGSAAGRRSGPLTFGHLGFTGTSLWCDPDAQVVVSVLTNRVCPTRNHLLIRDVRPKVHDALFTLGAALAG